MKSLSLKSLSGIILTFLIIMMSNCSSPKNQSVTDLPGIIPLPVNMKVSDGQLVLTPETKIICPAGNDGMELQTN
jgi:hypothetical protein